MFEPAMSKLLMAYIVSGMLFMLFPGTLLGVWNLLQISGREHAARISPTWLQAHGHAQVLPPCDGLRPFISGAGVH